MFIPLRRAAATVVVALAVLSTACGSGKPPAVAPEVWATVNGHEIRQQDVEKAYKRAEPQAGASNYEEQTAKLNLLNELILQQILLARATDQKLEPTDAELDEALKTTKKGMDDAAFEKALSARSLTVADVKEQLRRDLTVKKLLDKEVTDKVKVTDQDVTDFYQANKSQFNRTEDAYHLAQIVVTAAKEPQIANRTGDDAISADAATAKARLIIDRLKGGTPFQELAMDYSEDPESAPRGGDVGFIPASALKDVPPQLRNAVLTTKVGDVTMVGMPGGYAIVAIVEKQTAGQRDPSMPDVKNSITAALRGPREQLLRTAFLNESRDMATVVNYQARRLVEAEGKLPK
ncbi:MAG TPA: SurA N-terminal domain-containing protein [Vicinamibacterales bacterium]|jgi:peptidyl-prolyl cis-trans isomerase SurA|nr:SurA N-terminal domain-containing protein [Vicinamibacterales bacterium]